ncbi:GNAT family N-acetyltransferase [bacterium DOLJORAL78_65_58]|nr:MAG: GNAT family N-acetyltransferase [bacterium DOLJORAL78_65_58]
MTRESVPQQIVPQEAVIREAQTREDFWKVLVVRGIVFMEEQKIGWAEEIDQHEDSCTHFLGEVDGQPVVVGRLRALPGGEWKLERVAVRRAWRGQGLARRMVQAMLAAAAERGAKRLRLHAQVYLADFYASFGFRTEGGIFQECGIDHVLMIREGSP